MARYIDEAELVKAIIRERDKIPLKTPCATYELLDEKPNLIGEAMRGGIRKALRCISEAPTADVVKVKHGEWFLLDECANEGVYCSVCRKKVYRAEYANQKIKSKFCPNCGAKMDGTLKESEVFNRGR